MPEFEPRRSQRKGGPPMRGLAPRNARLLVLILIISSLGLLLFLGRQQIGSNVKEFESWPEFMKAVREREIETVTVTTADEYSEYQGKLRSGGLADKHGNRFRCRGPKYGDLPESDKRDIEEKVSVSFDRKSVWPTVLLMNLVPLLLIVALVWFLFFRQVRSANGPGGVLSFGKSRAQLVTKEKASKTFEDVAGVDEAIEDVEEIIGFLKDPRKFRRLGGRIPRGVLLVGAPGTGKTLLAKAIAGEAGVPFYTISGSDFVEMFVGVGASRVRDLFLQDKENSPCVVFLDEIDAVGRRRGTGLGGGHDEREQTLNAILVEMDGFSSDEKVVVIAATNRPDVLDPALLRPGRFDRTVQVDMPDIRGREAIFQVYARKIVLSEMVDFKRLARLTPGFSGADIENMMNESALIAVMKDKDAVEMDDLEEARDKVRWGREKKSRVLDEKDRRITAVHESGHALVAHLDPNVEPLHKVTIMPRGHYLGATMQLPEKDEVSLTRRKLTGLLRELYAGRVAKELLCDDISSGAQNDLQRATAIARRMVCEWGMSEKLGPIHYDVPQENVFLGYELSRRRETSEATAVEIDREIRRIADENYHAARKLLSAHRKDLELITEALLQYEVLSAKELECVLRGEELHRDEKMRERARRVSERLSEGDEGAAEADASMDEGDAAPQGRPAEA